jgi:ribosomal protein S18 acetylase RimI-like enzyme
MTVLDSISVRSLDNPIWHALLTEQAYLAQGNDLAKRFPGTVAPLAGMRDQSAPAYEALRELQSGDVAALFLDTPPLLPPGWSMVHSDEMYQMVFTGKPPGEPSQSFRRLTQTDVPEMLALTKLTEPGPFLPRTIELGFYVGIHDSGSLVAMSGERLHLNGFTEVSAVCTHPDLRGRGYGHTLMNAVISGIVSRGETPILHARTRNAAVDLYRKMGFTVRRQLHLAVVKHGVS